MPSTGGGLDDAGGLEVGVTAFFPLFAFFFLFYLPSLSLSQLSLAHPPLFSLPLSLLSLARKPKLQDGVDAPPDEEGPPPEEVEAEEDGLDALIEEEEEEEDEDLSYAAMFAAGLGLSSSAAAAAPAAGAASSSYLLPDDLGAYAATGEGASFPPQQPQQPSVSAATVPAGFFDTIASMGAMAPSVPVTLQQQQLLQMQQQQMQQAGGYNAYGGGGGGGGAAAMSAADLEARLLGHGDAPPAPAWAPPAMASAADLEARLLSGAGYQQQPQQQQQQQQQQMQQMQQVVPPPAAGLPRPPTSILRGGGTLPTPTPTPPLPPQPQARPAPRAPPTALLQRPVPQNAWQGGAPPQLQQQMQQQRQQQAQQQQLQQQKQANVAILQRPAAGWPGPPRAPQPGVSFAPRPPGPGGALPAYLAGRGGQQQDGRRFGPPQGGGAGGFGGGRGAGGFGGGRSSFPQSGQQLLGGHLAPHRRPAASAYMDADEIDTILRIQWRSLTAGGGGSGPYVEDFYSQAVVEKRGGPFAAAAAARFAPPALRELARDEKTGGAPNAPGRGDGGGAGGGQAYVALEGLGKIPFSNVRRPRPLMDLGFASPSAPSAAEAAPADGGDENAAAAAPARPLDRDPALAARLVAEEAACLLLDVDDIDRLWAAALLGGGGVGGGGNSARRDEGLLRQRRSLLMEALCRALRLPETPLAPRASDGVFLRISALRKGRAVVGRGLRLLAAPLARRGPGAAGLKTSRPLKLVWAVLRCSADLFEADEVDDDEDEEGGADGADPAAAAARAARALAAATARADLDATAAVARRAAEALSCLESPSEAADAMAALAGGSLAERAAAAAGGGGQGGGGSPADNLLPLLSPGDGGALDEAAHRRPWLGDMVVALFERAAAMGLTPEREDAVAAKRAALVAKVGAQKGRAGGEGDGEGGGSDDDDDDGDGGEIDLELLSAPSAASAALFRQHASAFVTLLARHVRTLADVHRLAVEAGADDAAAYAARVAPAAVLRSALRQAGEGSESAKVIEGAMEELGCKL